MVSFLLNFIHGTQVGNWNVHLACAHDMLPWTFAYDCINYVHYLTVYWCDMIRLEETRTQAHK